MNAFTLYRRQNKKSRNSGFRVSIFVEQIWDSNQQSKTGVQGTLVGCSESHYDRSLEDITDQEDMSGFISSCWTSLAGKDDCTVLDENNQPPQIDECSEYTQPAAPPLYNFDDVIHVDPSPQATSALGEKFEERSIIIDEDVNEDIAQKTEVDSKQIIDVHIMVTNNETTINKEKNKDESELVGVHDVTLNDDVDEIQVIGVDDDETDEIEDNFANCKSAIFKLKSEVVEFDPERNVSSSFVPIEGETLSFIYVPACNQKEMARIILANEANASRAKSKAKASLSQLFSDISSKPCAVQSEVYFRLRKF